MTTLQLRMIKFGGHTLVLDPDRAVHWPEQRALIVADLHFGKAAIFRQNGLPVPAGTTAGDLFKLTQLLDRTQASRLLILGDCFHGYVNDPAPMHEQLHLWRCARPRLTIDLILGNHDRRANSIPDALSITVHTAPLDLDGITFAHEPIDGAARPVICGHIHPTASLRDFDGQGVRVPCFVIEQRRMILPAFGRFTGGCAVAPNHERQLYVAAQGRVIPVPLPRRSAAWRA